MKRFFKQTFLPYAMALIVIAGILGIFQVKPSRAVTASVNFTAQLVDHLGNILGGVASAATATANTTIQIVDSTGHVLDALGASSTIYPATVPTAGQVPVGNVGGTAYAPQSLSQDCTNNSSGVVTCLSSNGNAFTSAIFGGALNLTTPPAIGGTTAAAGTFTNINKVNAQGTIGSGGTLNCDESLGPICTATVGGGAFTIGKPTNGVINTPYMIVLTSTANVAVTWASGWLSAPDAAAGALITPAVTVTGVSGRVVRVMYQYDGANFQMMDIPTLTVYNFYAVNAAIGGLLDNLNFGAFSITGTSGAVAPTTGRVGPTGGGVLQSYGGTPPTISAGCGTSPVAPASPDSNSAFSFTVGTGGVATSCTIAFSASGPFHAAPKCIADESDGNIAPVAIDVNNTNTTVNNVEVDFAAATAAGRIANVICVGH
jgi:hypothetical protein